MSSVVLSYIFRAMYHFTQLSPCQILEVLCSRYLLISFSLFDLQTIFWQTKDVNLMTQNVMQFKYFKLFLIPSTNSRIHHLQTTFNPTGRRHIEIQNEKLSARPTFTVIEIVIAKVLASKQFIRLRLEHLYNIYIYIYSC